MSKLLIIDGNAIVHRAYHAIPPLTTKDGTMVNAVYGFTSMLLKVWKDLKPEYIAVTFDMAGPTFRHVQYAAYKATRVKADQALYDQIPLAEEMVRAFGLPVYKKSGFEADDMIGTIAAQVVEQNKKRKDPVEVFVVTGDMDTLQLVNDQVRVYTLRKGLSDIVIYDSAEVKNRFGFGPEHMVDYKALRGDTSDNIPGVPGIGEKTATELIITFGTVEALYKAIAKDRVQVAVKVKPSVLKKLIDGEQSARMSFELARINCAVPETEFILEDSKARISDIENIERIFKKFEFFSLLKRVPGFESKAQPEHVAEKRKEIKMNFNEHVSDAEIKSLITNIQAKKQYVCRAVLAGKEVMDSELAGLIVGVEESLQFVDLRQIKILAPVFADSEIELVGYDIKELYKALLYRLQIEIKNSLCDVMVASYLLNPGTRAHDARSIVFKALGKVMQENTAQTNLFGIDTKMLAQELFLLSQAAAPLKDELNRVDNVGLFQKVEMALIPVLAEMEVKGVAVDLKMLEQLSLHVQQKIEAITKTIYKLAGEEFNIASPIQLREILFEKMGLSVAGIKKGKTGLSTSAEELEKLRGLHPIIDEISEYREVAKLQNTYIDVLPSLINKTTGRIHTHFNQTVAATGRLSSADPNLQNIPIRTELGREIRKAFVAAPGNILISADYSQIELRIVASLAEDKKMIEIFNNDEDIHVATAAAIHNVPLKQVTKEMRRAAKEINFGVLYGMGSYGLSWRAGISQAEAKDFIKKYFETFSGVRAYIDKTLEFTKQEGYCETLFGRRRYLPELSATNFQLRNAAERMAINHPIQGTAADLIKMAMIEVQKKINGLAYMTIQVHDELVLEVEKSKAEEVAEIVKKTMEEVVALRVPVKVSVSINANWGDMK